MSEKSIKTFEEATQILAKYLNGELVEVVRCKDCEYDLSAMCPMIVDGEDAAPRADDYCSFGKHGGTTYDKR